MISPLMFILTLSSVAVAAPLLSTEFTSKTLECGEHGDCLTVSPCHRPCGCDALYYWDNITDQCLLDLEYLKLEMTEHYNTAEKIRLESEKVFGGILVSIILFGVCVTLCTFSACLYCCYVNYSDRKLRNDVKALTHKLKRDGKLPKTAEKNVIPPNAQCCSVIVEDAGVFVC